MNGHFLIIKTNKNNMCGMHDKEMRHYYYHYYHYYHYYYYHYY